MTKPSLAERRRELVRRCAKQRTGLAYELRALRPANPLAHPAVASLLAHRNWLLGGAAAALGLLAFRRQRLLALAGGALSGWRGVQSALALLARLRG